MEKTDLYKLILGIILIAAGILSVVLLEVLDIDMLIPIILVNYLFLAADSCYHCGAFLGSVLRAG